MLGSATPQHVAAASICPSYRHWIALPGVSRGTASRACLSARPPSLWPAQSVGSPRASAPRSGHVTNVITTPHSGYHFDGSPRRFFEGWYFKVAIPGTDDSFALIYSIEDPAAKPDTNGSGVGVQVMGPKDGYICQFCPDPTTFWADPRSLALGAALKTRAAPSSLRGRDPQRPPPRMVPQADFDRQVELGFQSSAVWHQGSIVSNETGTPGPPLSTVRTSSWAFSVRPVAGWGDSPASASAAARGGVRGGGTAGQRPTAGWLSVVSVFEPHWQVLMADGLASGWFEWGGKRYDFVDAPAYAEKNWGGGFPSKWHWVQCNTFDGQLGMSVTAVGARRGLLLPVVGGAGGIEEDVGMIGVHLPGGEFIEVVPWGGEVEWDVEPWGRWRIQGSNPKYEVLVEASCGEKDGTVLRAPTSKDGLAPFCKDTFAGRCRMRVWQRLADGTRANKPFVDATSTTAALEVGGGPWWSNWSARAAMVEPLRSLVQLPIDVVRLGNLVPPAFRPPGL